MKNIHFNLSDSDVNALCYAIEIMPAYDFFENEAEEDVFLSLASSSGEKLILHKQLTNREAYFVAFAVDCAFNALRGEMFLGDKELNSLRPYLFTINKLHSAFAPLLDEDSV